MYPYVNKVIRTGAYTKANTKEERNSEGQYGE